MRSHSPAAVLVGTSGWQGAGDANLVRGREVDVAVQVSPVGEGVGVGAVGVVIRVGRAGERLVEVHGRVAGDVVRIGEARVGEVAGVVTGPGSRSTRSGHRQTAAGCQPP